MFSLSKRDGYDLIEIHDPRSANALSVAGARQLAGLRTTGPLVVRSLHPRVFCAGGNLADHVAMTTAERGLADNAEIKRILDDFGARSGPKLAVIGGDVLGGGVEWLARFDERWATPAARMAFWHKRVGLTPGWGGGPAWSAWLGEARVRQLLMQGRFMSSHEALRLGVVDRVVNEAALDVELRRWARAIVGPIDHDVAAWRVTEESARFRNLWWGPAHRAALAAWAKNKG